MISFICNRLADFLCKKEIIPQDEKEIYVYGYEMILTTILGAVLVFVTALLSCRLIEAFCFFVVFVLTRQYCGGYHAQTRIICSVVFMLCYISVLLFSAAIGNDFSWAVHLVIFGAYFAAILLYAPVENVNKPLTETDIQVNRRKSVIISLVWFIAASALLPFYPLLSAVIDLTLAVIAVLIIFEVLWRKEEKK